MSDFIGNSILFIQNNIIDIMLIVFGFFIFLSFLVMHTRSLDNDMAIESMTIRPTKQDVLERIKKSFCQTYQGDSSKLETYCESLSENSCKATSCCVFAKLNNKDKCVVGNAMGPIFQTDINGNPLTIDEYYYKNKLYK